MFIAVFIAVLTVAATGVVSNATHYHYDCGENLIWTLKDGLLTISGTGPMYDDFDPSTAELEHDGPDYDFSAPWNDVKYDYGNYTVNRVEICEGVTSVGAYSFYYNCNLEYVHIPSTVTEIGDDAFFFSEKLKTIIIEEGIKVLGNCALEHCGIEYMIIPDSVETIGDCCFDNCVRLKSITIGSGVKKVETDAFYGCEFTDVYYNGSEEDWNKIVFASDEDKEILESANIHFNADHAKHKFGEWSVIKAATAEEEGTREHTCTVCGYTESETIPIVVDTTPILSSDGFRITLSDVYGVRDFFIARGTWSRANDCKFSNRIVRMDVSRKPDVHTFSYTLTPEIASPTNEYTIMVRYEDATRENDFIHFSLDLPTPSVEVKGLQARVSGLSGAKKITTAYGKYETPGEVKRAYGSRTISAKTVFAGREEYTIQYRSSGKYTIAVEYYNGYVEFFYVEIRKLTPGCIDSDSSVTFSKLDDLYVIRYAPDLYLTASDIKNAPGSRFIRPSAVAPDGTVTISGLGGYYSFLVQYTDGSQTIINLAFGLVDEEIVY